MFSNLNPTLQINNVYKGSMALEFEFLNKNSNISIFFPFFQSQNLDIDIITYNEVIIHKKILIKIIYLFFLLFLME